jgi:uncharacterized protein (TIGR02996 family)
MRRELVSLLEACKRDPEDDAPRLVLADWLEEHGDEDDRARAAFVRLHATSGPRRGRPAFTEWLEHQWIEAHRRWAPFQASLSQSWRATSDGGLVTAIASPKGPINRRAVGWAGTEAWAWVERLRVQRATQVAALMASPLLDTVGTLELEEARLGAHSIVALTACPELARLRGLGRVKCRVSALGPLWRSPHLTGLRWLRMTGTSLPADLATLSDPELLPALECLELSADFRQSAVAAAVLTAPRPLRDLAVAFSARDDMARGLSAPLTGLRRLRLSMRPEPLDAAALISSPCWPRLESFALRWTTLAEPEARVLASRPRPTSLSELDLTVDPAAVAALAPWFSGLTQLSLSHSRLGPEGAAALTAMPQAPLTLELNCCQIGDDGLAALARWPGLARCRVLSLHGNHVGPDGAAALTGSPHAAGLVGLNLGGNPLGERGVEAVLRGPWAGSVEELSVWNCAGVGSLGLVFTRVASDLSRLKAFHVGPVLAPVAKVALPHVAFID